MTNLIPRQATALKSFLQTNSLPIRGVFSTARDSRAYRRSRCAGIIGRWFAFLLLLGAACFAQADQVNCSSYPGGVIDGALAANNPSPDNVKIDTNCTIINYPGGMSTNFSFDNNDPTPYLVIFNNVVHTGQMSCNTVAEHKIWFTNGSSSKIQQGCQNLLIPVEKIDKQAPAATASIGVPFTYTLTIPVLYDAATGTVINSNGSLNDLHGITLTDDLNATGASLSYVSHSVYRKSNGAPVGHDFYNVGGLLTFNNFNPNVLLAGQQIVIEITAVLNDVPTNTAGRVFTNIAKWDFGRLIDGVFYDPLPGEWGRASMTIAEPNLVVTKSSPATAINYPDTPVFTIRAQNSGGSDVWNATILDNIPAGMRFTDPTLGLSARIVAADGASLVRNLAPVTDYTLNYTGAAGSPAGQLSLTMTNAGGAIARNQYLVIDYQTQLDPISEPSSPADGAMLTNVAGASQWFSSVSTDTGRRTYTRVLTDGTPAITDHEDSQTVSAALSGYYFEKTVENLDTGANPATSGSSGDRLRYRLRLFNVDQTFTGITVSDLLDVNGFDLASFSMVTCPVGAACTFNSVTGQLDVVGSPAPLALAVGGQLVVEFEIDLKAGLANGTAIDNQATLSADGGFTVLSDDPFINGVASPTVVGDEDKTRVVIVIPGSLAKANPAQTTATIGERFTYRVTVPAVPTAERLYDVRILDNLELSAADLSFVSAAVVSGGSWVLSNTGSATNVVLEDTVTGIDIPANTQAVIDITVELQNTATNQRGLPFSNSASYTFNRKDSINTTQVSTGAVTTSPMTVLEPELTASKAVSIIGKPAGSPATGGDTLEYTVTIPNGGDSTAFDTNIVDTLPANLTLVPGSATAAINGVPVVGFTVAPTILASGAHVWGRDNGDGTLDIPAAQSLVLTYRVTVVAATGGTISNSVFANWTSLQNALAGERHGNGCPTLSSPNDYCVGPATATINSVDNTAIAKAVVADSYAETPASTTDPVVRVGDTATYELRLSLQEYTTRSVVVRDALPAGMALDSFTVTPASGAASFSYTLAAQPTAGATGTLTWDFGDITNTPSNDGTPIDVLVIQYVARIVTAAAPVGVAHVSTITRDNNAELSYTGGDPALFPARLRAAERVEVRQPQMQAISKRDLGSGRTGSGTPTDPYQVNIASDVMNFQLASRNEGLAPAYNVEITDQLASELDETDLAAAPPLVRIDGILLTDGADYTYTAPARGGVLRITLNNVPVNPGQTVTVDYNLGFHTDLTTSSTFSNQAQLAAYSSLTALGRVYPATAPAQVWMTNLVGPDQLLKTLVSASEATIGDVVVYQIRVPAVPKNAALNNVVVTDNLHGALTYLSATAVDANNNPVALTDNSVAPGQVSLSIANIAPGQQAIITLQARVANNAQANAGTSVANTASYAYTGMPAGTVTASSSAPFTIIEPLLSVAKTASTTAPSAGDIVTYTVTFPAAGGAAGDNFASAFDLLVEDSLSLGLLYQPGSATLNGAGLADPATNGGDGVSTAQRLTWDPANGIDIDITEGTTATLTYQVRVLNSVAPGQTLTNTVIGRWTGLNGVSAVERTGSGAPAENDYVTQPVTQTMTTPLRINVVKSVINVSTGQTPGTNAIPGDTLRYTLVLDNDSIIPVNGATIVDNLAAQFAPGSLRVLSVSDASADSSNSSATGGSNGTGIVDIRNLTLGAQGAANETQTIVFEATLAAVLPSGTAVLNQAQLSANNQALATSNQTTTVISSAPLWRVQKISQDVTGDPLVLRAGDTLRYTITVKNTGNENAVNVALADLIPSFTTYVPNTTTLNGMAVADPAAGMSALQNGMLINAPGNTTAGAMDADASASSANVASITFNVRINSAVLEGTIVANQGFVNGAGAGSGAFPEQPSDDPATTAVNDPTRDIVGNLPLLDAQKTVALTIDANANGAVDPGDVLRYTLTVSNAGAVPATGVVLTDTVPGNTTYVADSTFLNGTPVAQPDGGVLPLSAGVAINSPASASGTIAAGASAVVVFDVQVNAGVAAATVISNQGSVDSSELPTEPTDADGLDANGDQPTTIVVGSAQQLSIVKEVFVVGGGAAQAGGQLDYVVRVTNTGTVPATQVVLTDDLSALSGQASYVAGSATLNGSSAGVSFAAPILTGDYAGTYGSLLPGASATLRFRVLIGSAVPTGTTISNTGEVSWNTPTLTASSTVVMDTGGIPGSVTLNGHVWHDANFSNVYDAAERSLSGWSVALYRSNALLGSTSTDANGLYSFSGLAATVAVADQYELRFSAPGATASTAKLGLADSVFTNDLQRISGISAGAGSSVQNLNLPIDPNGVVYDSILRAPVAGATLTLVQAGSGNALAGSCFDDPAQQNQVTLASGFYKFDVNFSDASCPAGGAYEIRVTPPATGYMAGPSRIIPPISSASTAAYSVPVCPGDANTASGECEVQVSADAPPLSVAARSAGTDYHLHLTLNNTAVPGDNQIFNNHIAIDPRLDNALSISKKSALVNVSRGQIVPYVITVNNTLPVALQDMSIVDTFPPGFKYVAGSSRVDGQPVEPVTSNRQLRWENLQFDSNTERTIKMLFIVGSGVGEGEYVNRAQVINSITTAAASGEATATVRVVPDPTFDCTDVIGKVFDDANLNGYQDDGEKGLPGVRVASARGLLVTTDDHGRFHITCAVTPDETRGSNFILKVDDRTLPTGYRMTTENPRVQRATRGKMMKFNFGATIHKVVRVDMANGVFEPGTTEMRIQWQTRMGLLMRELKKGPSILRVAYMAEVEDERLVQQRLRAMKKEIARLWVEQGQPYELVVETEVFWRTGAPPARSNKP